MEQPTAAQQVANIKDALLTALCKKADAEAEVETQNKSITALRNVLAGITVGQQMAAPAAPSPTPPQE